MLYKESQVLDPLPHKDKMKKLAITHVLFYTFFLLLALNSYIASSQEVGKPIYIYTYLASFDRSMK